MTTLRQELIKIGAEVVRHSKAVTSQSAEVAAPRALFAATRVGSVGCERRRAPGDRGSHADERGVEPRGMGKVRREGVARGAGERVEMGRPGVLSGLRRAAGPDRHHFVLEREMRPVSNVGSARPGAVPVTEIDSHLGNPGSITRLTDVPQGAGTAPVKRQAERDATGHCMSQPERVEGPPRLTADAETEFNVLMALGKAYYGCASVGRVLRIAGQIRKDDAESGFRAFTDAGEEARAIAEDAVRRHREESARQAYLWAANYLFSATYFVDGTEKPERFKPAWERSRDCWDRAVLLFRPPVQRVPIPYQGTTLPGYFFRVDDSGKRRPLLILNNGSDGSVLDMWTWGGGWRSPRLQLPHCRWPGAGGGPVAAAALLPPRLGESDHARRGLRPDAAGGRPSPHRAAGHQPGRLLGAARGRLRAPDRRRRR